MPHPPEYIEFLKSMENSKQYQILNNLVINPDASVDNALDQITDLTISALAPSDDENFTPGNVDYIISFTLMMLVQRLEPAKHRKLVQFLYGLQKRTVADPATGEPLTVGPTKAVLWTNLPSFGYTEMETWDECGGEYKDPETLGLQGEQRQSWINENAFIAQLTQAADISYKPPLDQGDNIHPIDRSHRALRVLKLAVENDDVPMPTLARTAAMEAACIWFIYSAARLWDNARYGRTYDSEDFGTGPGCKTFAARGWKGYERGRWEAWGERLREARGACGDERMEGLIDEALGCMRRVMDE